MSDTIHQNDVGTILKVCVKDTDGAVVDISTATTKQIILQKPDETTLTCNCSFYTDGTDGIIQYITQDGDLDQAGIWLLQTYIVMSGDEFRSGVISFKVRRNL
jgi:hypothetical protein